MAICGVATWVSMISLARRHGFVQAGLAGWVWVLGSGFEFGHGSLSRLPLPLCPAFLLSSLVLQFGGFMAVGSVPAAWISVPGGRETTCVGSMVWKSRNG